MRPNDLVEALARDLAREGGWNDPDTPWTENQVIIARGGAGEPVWRDFVDDARSLLGRETFTTLLAALQQVTAERDEARAKLLEFGEMYDREDKRVAAEIATATSELARLRAEGEALKRKRDMAADLVVSLCDSVLGNSYLGKEGEEELAADLKRLFTRTALARAATTREG